MGLAPYGKTHSKINIRFKLNGINTDFSDFIKRMPYSDVLNHLNSNFRSNPIKQKIKKATKKILQKNITRTGLLRYRRFRKR